MQTPQGWRLADNFWNLRDDAYDHPDRWEGLTANDIFQVLAEQVQAAEERGLPVDWLAITDAVIAWRASEGNPRPEGAG